ncbi:MAG: hypothetical protein WA945_03725 [Arcobacteraceae bacterium]
MYKVVVNKPYENFQDFLINIKKYFNANDEIIHKARNELKIINHNDVDTVVKSFKVPNIINKIAYSYFRDSKAKKSYEYSLKIKDFTPNPIGYIEFYENSLINDSYFISEKFEYDFTIREPLLDDAFENKDNILKAFAKFTYELHQNNIFHNDYSPGNILIKKYDGDFIFKIVDVNRMKFDELDFEDRAKSFSKLWARDDELEIISSEYLKYYKCRENFTQRVCFYSNKNKRIKNFKKRLKGKKVVD